MIRVAILLDRPQLVVRVHHEGALGPSKLPFGWLTLAAAMTLRRFCRFSPRAASAAD